MNNRSTIENRRQFNATEMDNNRKQFVATDFEKKIRESSLERGNRHLESYDPYKDEIKEGAKKHF